MNNYVTHITFEHQVYWKMKTISHIKSRTNMSNDNAHDKNDMMAIYTHLKNNTQLNSWHAMQKYDFNPN